MKKRFRITGVMRPDVATGGKDGRKWKEDESAARLLKTYHVTKICDFLFFEEVLWPLSESGQTGCEGEGRHAARDSRTESRGVILIAFLN